MDVMLPSDLLCSVSLKSFLQLRMSGQLRYFFQLSVYQPLLPSRVEGSRRLASAAYYAVPSSRFYGSGSLTSVRGSSSDV